MPRPTSVTEVARPSGEQKDVRRLIVELDQTWRLWLCWPVREAVSIIAALRVAQVDCSLLQYPPSPLPSTYHDNSEYPTLSSYTNMPLYGRNRLSIADIESDLHDLIAHHPRSHLNADGEPVVPAEALVDILTSYRSAHDNIELLSKEEEGMFLEFIRTSPGLEATTKVLVEFIAFRTASGDNLPESALSSDEGSESDSPHRGRRRDGVYKTTSRSSSSDSIDTSFYRPPSRPPSLGPPVQPNTPNPRDSVFDASKRQRSTPLVNNAPSSWAKRPLPASRRKSDAGRGGSDSEVSRNTKRSYYLHSYENSSLGPTPLPGTVEGVAKPGHPTPLPQVPLIPL